MRIGDSRPAGLLRGGYIYALIRIDRTEPWGISRRSHPPRGDGIADGRENRLLRDAPIHVRGVQRRPAYLRSSPNGRAWREKVRGAGFLLRPRYKYRDIPTRIYRHHLAFRACRPPAVYLGRAFDNLGPGDSRMGSAEDAPDADELAGQFSAQGRRLRARPIRTRLNNKKCTFSGCVFSVFSVSARKFRRTDGLTIGASRLGGVGCKTKRGAA